jgi:hypothetical protein
MAVKTVLKDEEVKTTGKIPQFLSAGGYKAKAHSQKQLDRAALKSGVSLQRQAAGNHIPVSAAQWRKVTAKKKGDTCEISASAKKQSQAAVAERGDEAEAQ